MNSIKWLGLFSLAVGLCILGYQAIESIMSQGAAFHNYTLVDMFGEEAFAWRQGVTINSIVMGVDYVVSMPAYMILLITGSFFLIINGIYARR
jgi:hypothetical protein